MKRFLSILTLICVLFSLCACGKGAETATEPAAGGSEIKELTNEDLYGHIDQFTPLAGVYKIWNAEGVKNIANHPDADFEILCNIDMEGAVLAPIPEFSGDIMGADFAISNFTVEGDGENFGFIGVNKGKVSNLILSEVTFKPGANAKAIGSLAGKNEKTILRATVNGEMTVEKAAADAACGGIVGINTGSLTNSKANVALYYNAPEAATVGSMIGIAQGGTVDKLTQEGRITVTGEGKTVGVIAGHSEEVVLNSCNFLGEDNSLNGKILTNLTGNPDDDEMVTVTDARLRDNTREPLPDHIRAVRDKVVKAMYDMGTIEWKVKEDLNYYDRIWSTTWQFKGIPYNHCSGSFAQAQYLIGDDGYLIDDVYDWGTRDSWDMYFGTDCSSSVQQAWWTVSNSTDTFVVRYMIEQAGQGGITVGDYDWTIPFDFSVPNTKVFMGDDEQVIYESYAAMRAGDGYGYCKSPDAGGHTRMAAEDPVVVRDQNGLIDPQLSYVISHEQGYTSRNEETGVLTSWRIGFKYYFANLYYDWAVPYTCEELLTGELEPVEVTLEGKMDGYAGMFTGIVHANYHLDAVTLKITDSQGNVVLDHPMWVDVQKSQEYGNEYYTGRVLNEKYDLANMAMIISNAKLQPGETYHYTLTAKLATHDNIVVNESSFTYGQA